MGPPDTCRQGYANGFKEKRVKTRVGEVELEIPKTRGMPEGASPFYHRPLNEVSAASVR